MGNTLIFNFSIQIFSINVIFTLTVQHLLKFKKKRRKNKKNVKNAFL